MLPPVLIVTDIVVLKFHKIEIKRELQRNFWTDFIKFMLKHTGGSTKERGVL